MSTPSLKNPFPGMNPFLEKEWGDVHTRLIGYIGDAVGTELPLDLNARTEEREVFLEGGKEVTFVADVGIREDLEPWKLGNAPQWRPARESGDSQQLAEPVIVHSDPHTERWIEIREAQGRLITVIELLSPSNKLSDTDEYIRRRRAYRDAGVNLVEIDLLRAGRHVMSVPVELLRQPAGVSYLVCVTRAASRGTHELYYCPLRQPLPSIRIPLRETDADVRLALQPLIDRCYEMGRYWQTDFSRGLKQPLPDEENAWVKEKLTAAGLRVEA